MAVKNIVEVMNMPLSIWQADFDTITVDVEQQAVLKDPAGLIQRFVNGSAFVLSSYLVHPGDPTGQSENEYPAGVPCLSTEDGPNGVLGCKFYGTKLQTGAIYRVLFLVMTRAYGFEFQTT
jgi:hypothetical protein